MWLLGSFDIKLLACCCLDNEATLEQILLRTATPYLKPLVSKEGAEVCLHNLTICQDGVVLPVWVLRYKRVWKIKRVISAFTGPPFWYYPTIPCYFTCLFILFTIFFLISVPLPCQVVFLSKLVSDNEAQLRQAWILIDSDSKMIKMNVWRPWIWR